MTFVTQHIRSIPWVRRVHRQGIVATAIDWILAVVPGMREGWIFPGERVWTALGPGAAAMST